MKIAGHAMVWIGYARDDEGKTVQSVACAGFDDGYLDTLEISWADTERGRGPTGTAIRTGKVSVCRNMLTDPSFTPWREQAIKRGYASSIVLPLNANNRIFGAITIYSREPDPFSADEEKLLGELANDLALGISAIRLADDRIRAEKSLRETAEDLARSNKDLEQFAYVASHDLQEPLRAVGGFLGILEKQYAGNLDAEARECIDFAMEGAQRMQTLIHDLLTFSRVGTRGENFDPTDMKSTLGMAMDNLRVAIDESGGTCHRRSVARRYCR